MCWNDQRGTVRVATVRGYPVVRCSVVPLSHDPGSVKIDPQMLRDSFIRINIVRLKAYAALRAKNSN
jgi:hypothetical protein